MKRDILFAGVGGQGILAPAAILAAVALRRGLFVKQSEVHGMAQRGGAVQAQVRISDHPVHSELIPRGKADLVLSMEPLESVRYLHYLSDEGVLLTAEDPVVNIPDYPELETLLEQIKALPQSVVVPATKIAREAGSALSMNMVLLGVAARFLPIDPESIEREICDYFDRKGEKIVRMNVAAFRKGMEVAA